MFSFPSMQSPDDVKRILNAELRLYNAVAANAIDVAFRIADLNLSAWKQAAADWSEKSGKLTMPDGKSMPQWFDVARMKTDLEKVSTYGQQAARIMQDFQGDMAKIAQQRATHAWNITGATTSGSQSAVSAGNPSAVAFIQDMVEQARKGYAQWTSNALHAMDAAETDLAHVAGGDDTKQTTKSRVRK